ncbi:efflux RND transporter periplasmic adaptor subunit [Agarilytica rhodophyticola]|uniref:efflux RND transporter periplasmic adaptor subunit n=1 Tax=Agarilytica rhodophyticola TaxID=1737490 RepID=UPI000B3443B3|nr:efflux RND transporter periplasmic adaptor subunit [Agarilytica rhodophyticola]
MNAIQNRNHHKSIITNRNNSLAIILALTYTLLCSQIALADDNAKEGLPVTTALVTAQNSYTKERIFTGRIEASRVSDAGFEIGGKLLQIYVDEGDKVQQGDVLAVLDVAQANAQRKEAAAVLEEARAALSLSHATLQRVRSVFKAKGVSRQELDEAENNRSTSAAAVKRARAALERIDVTIEKSTLQAPFNGVVTSRLMDEGRVISAGAPLMSLQENVSAEARISLANGLADNFKVGDTHELYIKNSPVSVTVKSILQKRDERMQTVDVIFSLAGNVRVRPGDLVELRTSVAVEEQGVWVPIAALSETVRGLWSVYFVDESNLAQRKALEIIYHNSDQAFVRGSLNHGDRIVTEGTHRIVPGQQLRIIDSAALALGE